MYIALSVNILNDSFGNVKMTKTLCKRTIVSVYILLCELTRLFAGAASSSGGDSKESGSTHQLSPDPVSHQPVKLTPPLVFYFIGPGRYSSFFVVVVIVFFCCFLSFYVQNFHPHPHLNVSIV